MVIRRFMPPSAQELAKDVMAGLEAVVMEAGMG